MPIVAVEVLRHNASVGARIQSSDDCHKEISKSKVRAYSKKTESLFLVFFDSWSCFTGTLPDEVKGRMGARLGSNMP